MFVALQAAGLTLKPPEIAVGPEPIAYLGYIISAEDIIDGKHRINAIREFPIPTCVIEICSVLGVVNFLRRFIPDHVEIARHWRSQLAQSSP